MVLERLGDPGEAAHEKRNAADTDNFSTKQ
jgi:uncharacterized membrane protein